MSAPAVLAGSFRVSERRFAPILMARYGEARIMAVDPGTFAQLLDAVARFVDERLRPLEARVDADDAVPDEIVEEMKRLGLFGLTIPEAYGGLGLEVSEEVRVAMRVGRTSPAFRSVFGTNIGIGSQGIVIDGTEAQKRRYLPGMAAGEIIGCFCLTEPDAGSDAAALRTSALRSGNGYALSGTKRYITNAPRADVFTVMARTDPSTAGARGISAFIVEADAPGIRLGKPERKMGLKGSHVCDVIFEDCRVPGEALIGGVEGRGFETAMKVLDRGRLHLAALCVGVARRLIADSLRYAMERRQFGRPISDFQLIQAMLADGETECAAAEALVLDAARRRDAGEPVTKLAAMCKYFASEMVGRVADRAVQIHGGAGYIADYGIERFYRDVRLFRLYEGTSQIQQLIIAREMLKEAS
jgi:acyl-CoA dehydrogenase